MTRDKAVAFMRELEDLCRRRRVGRVVRSMLCAAAWVGLMGGEE